MQPKSTLENLRGLGLKLVVLSLVFFLSLQSSNAQNENGKKNVKLSENPANVQLKKEIKSKEASEVNLKMERRANVKTAEKKILTAVKGSATTSNASNRKVTPNLSEEKQKLIDAKNTPQKSKTQDNSKDIDPKSSSY